MDIQGLLNNPMINLGVGLLSQSGPSPTPINFGQAMGNAMNFASQRQHQQMQLEAQRQALEDKQNRAEAMSQIGGLLNNTAPAGIRAPAELQQQRLMGLLSQANPEGFVQGLLDQQFNPAAPNTSAALADWVAMGGNPNDMEGFQRFKNGGEDLQDILTRLQIEGILDERDGAEQQEQTDIANRQDSLNTSVSQVGSIASNLQKINNTFLETGAPWPEARRSASGALTFAKSLVGMDTSEQEEIEAAYDTLNKDLAALSLDTIRNFSQSMTNPQIAILNEASANPSIRPEAIASVLETILDARVTAARNDPNLNINDQDQVNAIRVLLNSIKAGSAPGSAQAVDWNEAQRALNGEN